MSKLPTLPLADLFTEIGLPLACRLMEEVQHMEPLARRFVDEFPKLRRRNPKTAAQMIQDLDLDTKLFKDVLVSAFVHHQRRCAQLKQAQKLTDITEVSTTAAQVPENFDERREHLRKHEIFDKDIKGGVNVNTQVGILNQPGQLPSFESDVMELESRMKQLPPATQQYVDSLPIKDEERVPA